MVMVQYLRPDRESLNDVVCPISTLSGLLPVPNSQVLPDTRTKKNKNVKLPFLQKSKGVKNFPKINKLFYYCRTALLK